MSGRNLFDKRGAAAFTIVELLIVVVVIAILAAITIVAYTGITQQTRASAIQADLASIGRVAEVQNTRTQQYPADLSSTGLLLNPDATYVYRVNNTSSPTDYCVTGTDGEVQFSVWRDSGGVREGLCTGFNYATNGSVEEGTTGLGWGSTNGASVEQSSVRASVGSYSARIWQDGSAGSDRYAHYRFYDLEPGVYTVTADVYLTGSGATDYSRGMWVNSDNPGATFGSIAYAATTNAWQTVTRTATVTQSAGSMTVRFYAMAGSNIYVDNVRIVLD